MLSILFMICVFLVFGKILGFAIRAAWSIGKILVSVVFLPVTLICMAIGGLLSIAFPLLILIGFGAFLLRD
ncbi:MAG: hypothetical protein Q4B85_08825 [Lachnospiraceae bacterium]|nr:hypothetical protein [Lachnospiraceae bacterium]